MTRYKENINCSSVNLAIGTFDYIHSFDVKIAGDLLDLAGDSSFETVQDLILVRIGIIHQIRSC